MQMKQINECCKEQEEAPAPASQGASCLVYFGSEKTKQIYTSGLNDCFPFMLQKKKIFDSSIAEVGTFTLFFSA